MSTYWRERLYAYQKLHRVGRVTVRIDNDHARIGNQTIRDYDFLDETLVILSEKVEEWLLCSVSIPSWCFSVLGFSCSSTRTAMARISSLFRVLHQNSTRNITDETAHNITSFTRNEKRRVSGQYGLSLLLGEGLYHQQQP